MGNNFDEVLKTKEETERQLRDAVTGEDFIMDLSDTQRVKVLSPGRLVAKRFFRNKLAIIGSMILVAMFIFAFLCPLFYSYGQTDIFYKYADLRVNYAQATERADYSGYVVDGKVDVHYTVENNMTSFISQMESEKILELSVKGSDGSEYTVLKLGDYVYTLNTPSTTKVAEFSGMSSVSTYNSKIDSFTRSSSLSKEFKAAFKEAVDAKAPGFEIGEAYYVIVSEVKNSYEALDLSSGVMKFSDSSLGAEFTEAFVDGLEKGVFEFEGVSYSVTYGEGQVFSIYSTADWIPVRVYSLFTFDSFDKNTSFSDDFKANALLALYDNNSFDSDGIQYTISGSDEGFIILENAMNYASLSTFVVRRYTGEDTLSMEFKERAKEAILKAEEAGQTSTMFIYALPQMDSDGNYIVDENGQFDEIDTEITATLKVGSWVMTCEQVTHLIDIYGPPSRAHIFGTDADGFDILARMMYGGRVSLLVGFVVVILEIIIGVILGGIAGYFSSWVDTLIMRMVDVFYCIPTYPILIILGAFFDSEKMGSYMRLLWMMIVMGVLGWAPVARLVRGQILSLREQEFMTAAESTGISTRRKIFRHLIPNVMPQLIVSATMGLGSVIIMESTLSFLGLGVKHPLATWGTMINSITSSNENLIRYAYIWIPIGLLICLTVIAFNFVGDGLRDAFDPKMKQ